MPKAERGVFEKVPGSGVWWVRYTDSAGVYRREKAGTWSMAKDLLVSRQDQARRGIKLPDTLRRRSITFSEIAEDALAYSEAHKRSYRDDKNRMERLKEWFGDRQADAITGHDLEERLNAEAASAKWAPSTFNHYKSLLQMAFREARRASKVTGDNPARDVRHRREDNSRVRYLSRGPEGEYERLLKVIRKDYAEHVGEFLFAVNTGLRLSSQYSATYDQQSLDLANNVLHVPRTKNDEAVHQPLNANALAALRSLPSWSKRSGPIFRNIRHPQQAVKSCDHWFKPALTAAGITDFKWHDLRHTFASWLIQDGVPLERVSKLLGHKSLAMTMRYAHLAPNQLSADVAKLDLISTTVAPEPVLEKPEPTKYTVN
jgi:integrase